MYGFGYNVATKDYEIIRIATVYRTNGAYYCTRSCIYSLRYDRWRRIKSLNYEVPNGQKGVLVNGSLHWMVSTQCSTARTASYNTLIAFDFTTEKFREVRREDYDLDGLVSTNLAALDEKLCTVNNYHTHARLWVMKEYGVMDHNG
ncbi:hypothetical protein IFM89_015699 [Coptis chinensis]|uniref:F-box associated beta-propeller type 1 domain-containing protein n=1 Tax=Coptis chinensis TaxID=261450 RepID=A0A835IAD6_9MAGN|nr:hypothetical protein IFM89_015699 [Coptis chinensis]